MEELSSKKRVRDESDDSGFDSPEVKRLREDLLLLENFDDSDFCTASHELDSFMKSFEEEIASVRSTEAEPASVVDLTSVSDDSQPELGYLLGASDDDLGIPPSGTNNENEEKAELIVSDSSELSELWGFDEGIPSFDSFEYGIGGAAYNNTSGGEYVSLDGLFDYSDMGFGSTDFSWRPETLPAK
ncbi:hypothetical protein M9H77_08615 [Catharanthus roseus]|uniref:Uncharacterized protein n=1 Tax=Catharanthus roseus TaxID=4058 RepID=A0ACC0BYD9_CATRO|nr:hypothetical protein M9H77_08615 [Catharanthus roseus]